MPAGAPTVQDLRDRLVTFFSIDTNVLRESGYRFSEGALNQLHNQVPIWLQIQLTEVVEREVLTHRMAAVDEAMKSLRSAAEKASRSRGASATRLMDAINDLNTSDDASARFVAQFREFAQRLRGGVLPIAEDVTLKHVFDMYFNAQAPFENRTDKKHEFPDAVALLLLEAHAREASTCGILVSNDNGWHGFAAQSRHLYCVRTLEDFTRLFASHVPNAEAVKEKLRASLNEPGSVLHRELDEALRNHVENSQWSASEIYTGFSNHLEAEAYGRSVSEYSVDVESLQVWFENDDAMECTVEMSVDVTADIVLDIKFEQWDSIDKDYISCGSNRITVQEEVEVSVFLRCDGDFSARPLNDWNRQFDIADGKYTLQGREVEPDWIDQ